MGITGAGGAGKSTRGRAWARQAQIPVPRPDDDPDVLQPAEPELPDVYQWTEPQPCARQHARRRQAVQEEWEC
jgi:hypothetical protein